MYVYLRMCVCTSSFDSDRHVTMVTVTVVGAARARVLRVYLVCVPVLSFIFGCRLTFPFLSFLLSDLLCVVTPITMSRDIYGWLIFLCEKSRLLKGFKQQAEPIFSARTRSHSRIFTNALRLDASRSAAQRLWGRGPSPQLFSDLPNMPHRHRTGG